MLFFRFRFGVAGGSIAVSSPEANSRADGLGRDDSVVRMSKVGPDVLGHHERALVRYGVGRYTVGLHHRIEQTRSRRQLYITRLRGSAFQLWGGHAVSSILRPVAVFEISRRRNFQLWLCDFLEIKQKEPLMRTSETTDFTSCNPSLPPFVDCLLF